MEIPEVVILRLPVYVRALTEIEAKGSNVVSSHDIGEFLHITPAQIRKDLSYFGRFGRQGSGYNVKYLVGELKSVLGLDEQWNACIVGLGRLGCAIASYPGFAREGFEVVASFDADPNLVGKSLKKGLNIQPMSELCQTVKENGISIGIVAVPAAHAQKVIDQLMQCGIKAILNYAPIAPHVPEEVKIRNIDPTLALQTMTYYLKTHEEKGPKENRSKKRTRKRKI